MERVRIAVIGCGSLANAMHYPSLHDLPDAEVVGCCDLSPDRLAATASRFGIANAYSDYRTMLREQDPDAVYVLMPPHQLFDLCADVLDAGKHLFIEKPPTLNVQQISSLARRAERAGCLTMTAFNRRFSPVIAACLQPVRAHGPIEQLAVSFYKHHFAGEYYRGAVDILTSDAIHAVDLCRHLGGDVKRVRSCVRRTGGESIETSWNALLEFESGACGLLLTCWTVGRRFHSAEFHARAASCYTEFERDGTVWADGNEAPVLHVTAADLAGRSEAYHTGGFYQENAHFVECVRRGQQPLTHFGEATKTMELVAAIARAE